MESQLTVRLPEELKKALDRACGAMNLKASDVVRLALKEFLRSYGPDSRPADRVRGLVGSLESGIPDLAENQPRYIVKPREHGE